MCRTDIPAIVVVPRSVPLRQESPIRCPKVNTGGERRFHPEPGFKWSFHLSEQELITVLGGISTVRTAPLLTVLTIPGPQPPVLSILDKQGYSCLKAGFTPFGQFWQECPNPRVITFLTAFHDERYSTLLAPPAGLSLRPAGLLHGTGVRC